MLKVLDLFSGVGGMSLGATQAGFSLAGAVELDSITIETHKVNFPKSLHIQSDISTLKGNDLKKLLKIKSGELSGIIGGPPCQGFSTMGKRDVNDPRNTLFIHFFRIVKELQPDFFVAENVPGILNQKFNDIRNIAFGLIENDYNLLAPIIIRANEIGVPTIRKRVFFIGLKKSRMIAIDNSTFIIDQNKDNYVKDALLGLPLDIENDESKWKAIKPPLPNTYSNNISKLIFESGVGSQEAIERYFVGNEVSGIVGTNHNSEVIERFRNVPQGGVDKISKSPRLSMEGFCPTLRAGTGRDKGSHQALRPIHPIKPRVIYPREAARIQGFPDWFQFHDTKWHSFRQIGNSVSPIVAEYILSRIFKEIY